MAFGDSNKQIERRLSEVATKVAGIQVTVRLETLTLLDFRVGRSPRGGGVIVVNQAFARKASDTALEGMVAGQAGWFKTSDRRSIRGHSTGLQLFNHAATTLWFGLAASVATIAVLHFGAFVVAGAAMAVAVLPFAAVSLPWHRREAKFERSMDREADRVASAVVGREALVEGYAFLARRARSRHPLVRFAARFNGHPANWQSRHDEIQAAPGAPTNGGGGGVGGGDGPRNGTASGLEPKSRDGRGAGTRAYSVAAHLLRVAPRLRPLGRTPHGATVAHPKQQRR